MPKNIDPVLASLACSRLNLDLGALSSLFADFGSLSAGSAGSRLGLLGLLFRLSGSLLLLAFPDSLSTGGGAGGGGDRSLFLNHVKRGTNNSPLVLDGSSGSLLGNFLRDTLLVHPSVQNSPGDSSRVLPLQEQTFALSI